MAVLDVNFFTPGLCSSPGIFGLKLMISHGVNHRDRFAAVIQRPLHPLYVPVFLPQFHGVELPGRMWCHILRQSKGLRRPLHILLYHLSGVMLPGVPAWKDPVLPGVFA